MSVEPKPGDVFETVAYRGHVYMLVNADAWDMVFALLSVNPRLSHESGNVGKRFTLARSAFEFGLQTNQIERVGGR